MSLCCLLSRVYRACCQTPNQPPYVAAAANHESCGRRGDVDLAVKQQHLTSIVLTSIKIN
jgi:hypothetical protein